MKKILSLLLTAILLTVFVSLSLLAFNTSAAETSGFANTESKNVIFVSDNVPEGSDGSGRNAENPFRPDLDLFYVDEKTSDSGHTYGQYHLRTALYQAAYKLADTGGTIVICGPVEINASNSHGSTTSHKDFSLPTSKHELTITSKYNGVDYALEANGGAYLGISSPSYLLMGSPSVFENITIKTGGANRAICACGNRIEMGEGVKCGFLISGTADSGANYISIAGGKRYGSYTADSNVIIKSGTYGHIAGSTWGAERSENVLDGNGESHQRLTVDVQTGNININILGGTVRSSVCGTSQITDGVSVDGNVNINIGENANVRGNVYANNESKFINTDAKVYIKLSGRGSHWLSSTGGYMTVIDASGNRTDYNDLVYAAAEYTLDIADAATITGVSGMNKDDLLKIIVNKWDGNKIIYPSSWLKEIELVEAPTVSGIYFDGITKPTGAVIEATYENKLTNEDEVKLVEYDERNTSFKSTYNAETNMVTYSYGGIEYYSQAITNYVKVPEVELLGVRIKTDNTAEQGMRFVAKYDRGVTIDEMGVIVVKSHAISDPENITLENTFGQVTCTKIKEYSKEDGKYFECDYDYPIKLGEYNTNYTARAYVKYTVEGVVYTSYSDAIERNLYEVARAAVNDDREEGTTKTNLTTNVLNKINVIDDTALRDADSLADMRNKVTAYMDLQANIEWTPSETFLLYNDLDDADIRPYRYVNESGYLTHGVEYIGLFEKDKTYKGLPYISSSDPDMEMANYESFASYINGNMFDVGQIVKYNEDGTLKKTPNGYDKKIYSLNKKYTTGTSMEEFIKGTHIWGDFYWDGLSAQQKGEAYINYTIFPGSHCIQAVISAWNTIINNRDTANAVNTTKSMVPGGGNAIIPVGNYDYVYSDFSAYTPPEGQTYISDDTNKYQTADVGGRYQKSETEYAEVRASDSLYISKYLNDKETMYAAYSELKAGDAIIEYTYTYKASMYNDEDRSNEKKWVSLGGHTRLIISVDTVNKTVTTLECATYSVPYHELGYASDVDLNRTLTENNSCWMQRTYSFDRLIDTGYLPVTLPELRTGIQEQNYVVMTDAKFGAGVIEGTITSSKQIVSATVVIKNGNEEVYNETKYLVDESVQLGKYDISKLGLGELIESGETYTVTITIGTPGEVEYTNDKPTGYIPTLTPVVENYTFTA